MTKLEKAEKLPILLLERILLQPMPWFWSQNRCMLACSYFCSVLQFSKTWLDSKKTLGCVPFQKRSQ